jgi:hypothetical protein
MTTFETVRVGQFYGNRDGCVRRVVAECPPSVTCIEYSEPGQPGVLVRCLPLTLQNWGRLISKKRATELIPDLAKQDAALA